MKESIKIILSSFIIIGILAGCSSTSAITVQEAKETALTQIDGEVDSVVEEDDEYTVYITKDNYLYEIDVDKSTGDINDINHTLIDTTIITQKEAKEIALNEIDGTFDSIGEDDDDYIIYIEKDNYLYEVYVNKITGIIDSIDKEEINTTSDEITLNQAKEIALTQINDGTIVETETDTDEYDIFILKGSYLYEVEIDRATGSVLGIEKELSNYGSKIITEEEAETIALKEVDGTVKSISYDNEDNAYEVEIKSGSTYYEIIINAYNGNVIEVDKD